MSDKIITIAFPSKGASNPAFAAALKQLAIPQDFNVYEVLYVTGADVATARNKLINAAKGDYVFMIDDDVLPSPDTLIKLYERKKDIVLGLYFARQAPHYPQIHKINKEDKNRYDSIIDYPKEELVEIDAGGAGCMLIKRDIFQKIKQPYFQYIPPTEDKPLKGEDFFFCEKLRKANIKIYCDTSAICRHIGEQFIGPEHWMMYREKLRGLEEQMGPEAFKKYKENVIKYQDTLNKRVNK